jgi:1-phosphofructokinase family hexose kinase
MAKVVGRQAPTVCVLSLNPAIDAEWRVDEILWEEKNIVHTQRRWAGGKGANVVRWLRFLGARPELLIPLGGVAGGELAGYLEVDEIRARIVPLGDETRVNVVITDRTGRQMRFNQPGARVRSSDWKAILNETRAACRASDALILSGSLPPGTPVSGYAEILRMTRRARVPAFLDCDGATLKEAVPAQPFLVKPNQHELSGWYGQKLRSAESVRKAAFEMSRLTGGWILVSLGAEGAMMVNAKESFAAHARAGTSSVLNTLGAGDATLSGAAHSALTGQPPVEWLRAAVAAGTAATQTRPGTMLSRRDYEELVAGTQVKLLR